MAYRAFDLSEAGRGSHGEMLAELLDLFEQVRCGCCPPTVWDVRELPAALRHMSQAGTSARTW